GGAPTPHRWGGPPASGVPGLPRPPAGGGGPTITRLRTGNRQKQRASRSSPQDRIKRANPTDSPGSRHRRHSRQSPPRPEPQARAEEGASSPRFVRRRLRRPSGHFPHWTQLEPRPERQPAKQPLSPRELFRTS